MGYRRKKKILQKAMGILVLIVCALIVYIAVTGNPDEADVTPAIVLTPIGLQLLFSKGCCIF